MHAQLLQSCPTVYDPPNCNPPGSPVHGILPARVLECVVIFLTQGSNPPLLSLLHCRQDSLLLSYRGNLITCYIWLIYSVSLLLLNICFLKGLEQEMATHSSILAWRIPWTEETSRLQSPGHRVGLDWATSLSLSLRDSIKLGHNLTLLYHW